MNDIDKRLYNSDEINNDSKCKIEKENGLNEDDDNECFLCLELAQQKCKQCSLPYCQKSHYDLHVIDIGCEDEGQNHLPYCYPFRVRQRPEVGKYLVATRDISPLDLILIDYPVAFGPNHDTAPVCLECLLPINENSVCNCPSCGLPLCSKSSCREQRELENGQHMRGECRIFSQSTPSGFKFKVKLNRDIPSGNNGFLAPEYSCITPLRLLMLKETDDLAWKRLSLLMDHDEDRKKETDYQKMFQVNVVDFLRKVCGFDYSEKEIFRVIGLLRTNALQIQDPIMKKHHVTGRAIYPTFSFLSHSCISNARYSIEPQTQKLVLRAQMPIKKGEEITVQYISFMFGQCRRKKEIPLSWFFDCRCSRCSDSSECGSLLSAMLCERCEAEKKNMKENEIGYEKSYLLPEEPFNVIDGKWICQKCSYSKNGRDVDDICEVAATEVANASEDVSTYNALLMNFSTFLHPNHYLIMTLKKYIADSLGTANGYAYPSMSDDQLDIKIDYSKEFLSVVSLIDPGVTKWRGCLLFELQTALYWKANKKFAASQILKQEKEHQNISKTTTEGKDGLSKPLPQCYSTCCRKNINYICYSSHCPNRKKIGIDEAKKMQHSNLSAKDIFIQELRVIQDILRETLHCLQKEAENTIEGFTYKRAKKASIDINELLFFSEFI